MSFFERFLDFFAPSAPTRDLPFTTEYEAIEHVTPRRSLPPEPLHAPWMPEEPAMALHVVEYADAARDPAP